MTTPDPVSPAVDSLRRAWFVRGEVLGDARMGVLQAWHDAERHQDADSINGSCFCCCEECDPR